MKPFAATGELIRFIVRRHWLRILVWVGAIAALVFLTAASVEGIYPTQAALDQAAAATKGNAAAIVFNGPDIALNTKGGQIVFQVGAFGLVIVGLMSVLMIGALTRGEEESGRMELVRSLPVGRHAAPMAAFAVVGAMSVAIGVFVATAMLSLGLAATGSIIYALSFALTGLMFAGVAGITAQVSENTRVAYGLGGTVLGIAFALRAVGDVTDGTLSWLSPIGVVQKAKPFGGDQWLPLVFAAILTLLCFAAGARLSARRDLAAGLLAPRAGPARAGRLLSSVEGLAVRLHRGSLVGWTVGVVLMGAAYGSLGDSVEDFIGDNEQLLEMIARAGGNVDLTASFLATSFQLLCVLGAAFGIQAVHRLRTEETGLQAEPLLATAVSRRRWALSHIGVAVVGSVVILVLGGAAVGLSYALVTGNYGRTGGMLQAAVAYVPAVWTLIGVGAASVGLLPRITALGWSALAFVFAFAMFGDLLGLPQWVANLSPVGHVPLVPAVAFAWVPFLLLSLVALALLGTGVVGIARRDLG